MAKARYPVEAHLVEGRSVSELAAAHGVHRSWIYEPWRGIARAAMKPWSLARGRRAQAPTARRRILRRGGLVVPTPKRPRSSLIRFEAQLPNEMWQADITHWRLAEGQDVEVLTLRPAARLSARIRGN